ncbi:unnamed protein product [Rhodiola kirilowii]
MSAAYREVLKALKKHVGSEDHHIKQFRDFVSQQFRKTDVVQGGARLARDYAFLLNSVHHHKDLLFSYNIAVDRSDEMKKVLRKSAASVGLQLPDVYQS